MDISNWRLTSSVKMSNSTVKLKLTSAFQCDRTPKLNWCLVVCRSRRNRKIFETSGWCALLR